MNINKDWYRDKFLYYKGYIGSIEPDINLGYHGRVVSYSDGGSIKDSVNYHGSDMSELFYHFGCAVDTYEEMQSKMISEGYLNRI